MIVHRRITVISYINGFFSQSYIIMQQAKFNHISGVIICLTFAGLLNNDRNIHIKSDLSYFYTNYQWPNIALYSLNPIKVPRECSRIINTCKRVEF